MEQERVEHKETCLNTLGDALQSKIRRNKSINGEKKKEQSYYKCPTHLSNKKSEARYLLWRYASFLAKVMGSQSHLNFTSFHSLQSVPGCLFFSFSEIIQWDGHRAQWIICQRKLSLVR